MNIYCASIKRGKVVIEEYEETEEKWCGDKVFESKSTKVQVALPAITTTPGWEYTPTGATTSLLMGKRKAIDRAQAVIAKAESEITILETWIKGESR